MKKIITCITMLSMLLASVPASAMEAAAAPAVMTAAAEQEKAPAELIGRWYHQAGDKKNGYVMVEADGTYSYFDYAKNTAYGGTVKTEYDTHPDGSKTVLYSFYDNSGKFLFGCSRPGAKTDTIPLGQDGAEKLVRDTKNYETASIQDITGRFTYHTLQSDGTYKQTGYVIVNEDGTFSYSDDTANKVTGGTVRIDYEVYPNGSTNAWYGFLDNDGKDLFSCTAANDSNEFMIGNGGMAKLVRDTKNYKTASIKDIAGVLYYQKLNEKNGQYETVSTVTVSENGTYTLTDAAGKTAEGTVTLQYEEKPDGSTSAWFSFTDKSGNAWFGCYDPNGSNLLTNGGSQERMMRDSIPGDLTGDGTVGVDDAQLTLKAYTQRVAGKAMGLTNAQIKAADIDGNSEISVEDAQLILKYYTAKSVAGKDITWNDLLKKK